MARKFKFDESKLKPKQREVALALVEREFAEKKERKTKTAICEQYEISMMGLWKWENNDENFIAYKNHLASQVMDSHLPAIYRKVVEVALSGNTKALELFLKRIGDLDTKTDVTVNNSSNDDETQEERIARLTQRLAEADGEEGED